ncbi:hypothetical protein HUB98_16475 [Paenibacillus barcinonensis]|uniref:Uncharacterized protein n=1 Tax=Paenibacillus barcinonensis TaxID=198119 RepID=A0A2V4VV07_PAEBA|nr:hypothetical protein [Paenibacillus barcinonensis]PYE48842.1 hypothetical protein DFQ00_107135 [Paenibacillus barcinonensis]QKS57734.1 hypothetical protein HUB98_16475 [Paenibacillus barcinonensis]
MTSHQEVIDNAPSRSNYTGEEHIVYIGKIAKYRRLTNQGISKNEASETCAQEIIRDETGPEQVLEERYNNTQDAVSSFAAHVRRMEEVCAGESGPLKYASCHTSEKTFYGILPR